LAWSLKNGLVSLAFYASLGLATFMGVFFFREMEGIPNLGFSVALVYPWMILSVMAGGWPEKLRACLLDLRRLRVHLHPSCSSVVLRNVGDTKDWTLWSFKFVVNGNCFSGGFCG
jgi:hypothetical protein